MPPRDLFLDLTARPVIAHRGASGLRPENTLAAFELARTLGADGLEFDLQLSADGVPVVHHDPTLERTTNLRGPVNHRTAAELARADAGGGEHVPTLAVVLEATGDLPLLIELKTPGIAGPLVAAIRRAGAEGRVALASFHPAALAPLRGSGLPLGATRPEIARAWAAAALGWPAGDVAWQFYAVPDRYRDRLKVPTRRFVARARRQGCPVHVWTVDEPARAVALWRDGVAGIVTNRPDLILAARDRAAVPLVEEP
jgi:glycerophosphoryl diester phosphodiesterase